MAKTNSMKKIHLSNRSRSNRMFYDMLIRELAICINVGDTVLNRDLELPSYRGKHRRLEEDAIPDTNKQAIGFDTPRALLPASVLNSIDRMLTLATIQGLTGCNSTAAIRDFLMQHTDLTTCHTTALNNMYSLKYK